MKKLFRFNILTDEENKKYRSDVLNRINYINATRGKILLLLVAVLELILIIGFDINNLIVNGWSGNHAGLYLILHLFIMITSILASLSCYIYQKNKHHKLFELISFETISVLSPTAFLFGITLITGLDQTISDSISNFLFFILLISLFSLSKPKNYTYMIIFIYNTFIITMLIFQPDKTVMIGNIVNGTLAVLTSAIISYINYLYVYDYQLKSIKLEEAMKQLEHLSITDELTGVYNRRKFEDDLKLVIENNDNKSFALLMIDIDHFKLTNDTHGHLVGDLVLNTLGSFLKDFFKNEGIVSRYGGEEFVIILKNINLDSATKKAELLRLNVEKFNFDNDVKITISIGVTASQTNDTVYTALDRVDKALYLAKEAGRNVVKAYKV